MLGNTLEELALGFCERDGKKSQLRDPDHVVALLDPLKRLQHLFLSSEVNVAWPASLANAMAIKCRINKATIKRITIGSIKAGKKHLWDQLLNGCFPNLEYLGLEGRSLKTLVKRLKLEYAPVVIELVQFEDYVWGKTLIDCSWAANTRLPFIAHARRGNDRKGSTTGQVQISQQKQDKAVEARRLNKATVVARRFWMLFSSNFDWSGIQYTVLGTKHDNLLHTQRVSSWCFMSMALIVQYLLL